MSVDAIAQTANDYAMADWILHRFVARADVKARQLLDGQYNPDKSPLTREDVLDHLSGQATYGHYMMNGDKAKLFAFDVDFRDINDGTWIQPADLEQIPMENVATPEAEAWFAQNSLIYPCNPRSSWRDRAHPGRSWFKAQLREVVEELTCRIRDDLGIPTAAAYSGNKGVHVYGFTGEMPAAEIREAARLVLASWGRFEPAGGDFLFHDRQPGWYSSKANLEIEVFPKQDVVQPGKYGNLMRLPLGKNHKNPLDPTFFIDQSSAHNTLTPASTELALQILYTGNPWSFR